jgi:hypothetical protein
VLTERVRGGRFKDPVGGGPPDWAVGAAGPEGRGPASATSPENFPVMFSGTHTIEHPFSPWVSLILVLIHFWVDFGSFLGVDFLGKPVVVVGKFCFG